MDFLLQSILSYLLIYKYVTLFTVTLLAAIALPIPSAATLMASAAFASQGYFNIAAVFLVAAAGNILGDNIGYWIARRFGKPVLYKIGLRKILESDTMKALEAQIKLRPGRIVFFSRAEVIATLSVNIISGLGKVPYATFFMYEAIGELVQVAMYSAIGYTLGSSWQTVNSILGRFSLVVTLGALLLVIFFWSRAVKWLTKSLH